MAETKTNVELLKLNVATGVSVPVDISIFDPSQVNVMLTESRVPAVQNVDYTVDRLVGSVTYRDGFRIIPAASMLAKIAATGLANRVYIRRRTSITSDFTETDSFLRDRIVDEFDKTIMRLQEMGADVSSAVRTPIGEAVVTFPSAGTRALKVLEFDADGKAVALRSTEGFDANVAAVGLAAAAVAADREAVALDKIAADSASSAAGTAASAAQTFRNQAEAFRDQAEGFKNSAQGYTNDAQVAKNASETARDASVTARNSAQGYANDSQTAKNASEAARDLAQGYRDTTLGYKNDAQLAKTQAESAQTGSNTARAAVSQLYQGVLTADPATDLLGNALTSKAYYYNSGSGKYRFYTGSAWQDSPIISTGGSSPGQCKLVRVSNAQLRLDPCDGNQIMIDGVPRTIPQAGVTLAYGSLAASTIYYIYASWDGTKIVLVASANAPVRLSDGVVARTGTLSHTLVGAVYTEGGVFTDTAIRRYIRSHFNETSINLGQYNSATTNNNGTTFNEILTALRVNALLWPGEEINGTCSASVANDTGGAAVRIGVGFNALTASTSLSLVQVPVAGLFNGLTVALNDKAATAAAGVYYIAPLHFTSGGVSSIAHVQQAYRTNRVLSY